MNESSLSKSIQYAAIGIVESPFQQKFAIPRQPNLVSEARGKIILNKEFTDSNALRELEQFSHIWVLFHFHETEDQGWTPTVQPPRLGGKTKVGVFASRSPFRPNAIGMSVLKNLGYEKIEDCIVVHVGGIDLLNGTPVLDIKPYIPYADSISDAAAGYAKQAPGKDLDIQFAEAAENFLAVAEPTHPDLRKLIVALLRQDPRPAWRVREDDSKQYGMTLYHYNIKWRISDKNICVSSIEDLSNGEEF